MSDVLKKDSDMSVSEEASVIRVLIDARKALGMTQKELSEATGIAQADISRLESGNVNPSLRTLQRLAYGMGMRLKLEFEPITR